MINLKSIQHYLLLILFGVSLSLGHVAQPQAAEVGRTLVAADLKQQPFIDAATVTNLPVNTELEVLKRQGGWMQVKSGAGEGWLKMTAVKLGTAAASQEKSGNGLSTLVNLATTGRSGSSGVTVTTGVRGLGQEDLKNAQPNPEAVKKMESFAAARNETAAFASSAKLQSQTVEYLSAPAATSASTGVGSAGNFGRGN
ncbi:MAG: ligand-binding protein SH3 [Betaproteobacteria bacterium HGW-Betaproteobacteria-1]|jgi:hypothetical protein|nr:MAG: ligand-binding protein SH3 [Betaproteobacteria bacterium HGW-Betaproteobacteria-1]